MLDALIQFSLRQRTLVLGLAGILLLAGARILSELPVEVLPDLTRPTVTILTEAPGLAPEEVEAQVTLLIESAIQGIGHLHRLRSSSDVGLSLVFAEFAWNTDIHKARQLVQERLQTVLPQLPPGTRTSLTPIASLMGEILLVGLHGTNGHPAPPQLRRIADWTVRRRLQAVPGVAEVLSLGGGILQVQVQPDPHLLAAHGIPLEELEAALALAAANHTGGYLQSGPSEIMIRNLAMTTDLEELGNTVIRVVEDRPVRIADVAAVVHGVQPMRGDASVNGHPGVILSIDKAPGFDTLAVTRAVEDALETLRPALPDGVRIEVLFRQADFILLAIDNLREAIRDGAVMVAVILFLFLLKVRTTLITLTAIPLSFAATLVVFRTLGVTVNSMTLGGLAVAIGMVVDDAIVDVENVYRRLRENARRHAPIDRLTVIARASREIRYSILYATLIIIAVFIPLLGLDGVEGRLFAPIAVATITSMVASFFVALTVIPALCSFLLRPRTDDPGTDTPVVRWLKEAYRRTCLRLAIRHPFLVLLTAGLLAAAALSLYPGLGREFLPEFNEGSATVTLAATPGTSLDQANEIGQAGVRVLQQIPEIRSIGRRAGRAERDDHVMPVSINEFDIEFHPHGRPRETVLEEIRQGMGRIPGTFVNVGQPLEHRIAHMLSGIAANVAVKIHGPDLDELARIARQVGAVARSIPGLTDVQVEPQIPIPQLQVRIDRDRAALHGLQPGQLGARLSTLLAGRTLAELRDGQQPVDLVLRLPDAWRDPPEALARLPLATPAGGQVPLGHLAELFHTTGPNVVHREDSQRRIIVGANTRHRDIDGLVRQLEAGIAREVSLPEGYFLRIEGEYQSRKDAARRIALLSVAVLVLVAFLLHGYFRGPLFPLQVFCDIPLALIGGLALTWALIGTVSIASLVGAIAVTGIAARNSILLLSHYLHLMRHDGLPFGPALVERGSTERLVPVLMTALSAGFALVPLLLAAGQPGKELLHPVAVVLVGGLVTATILGLAVTPTLFLLFGRRAAEHAVRQEAPATQ